MEKMVNIGCGETWHGDWINLDLAARSPGVRRHDLREGLPFEAGSVDACYSSHVLEHLDEEEAGFFMHEQHRVLRPGGIVRVAVPDLEEICRLYLRHLEKAAEGDEAHRFPYRYSYLELYDQVARRRSGGKLGALWRSGELTERQRRHIRARHGEEAEKLMEGGPRRKTAAEPQATPDSRGGPGPGVKLAKAAVRLLAGREALEAFREGLFRRSGEIHRVMYDRYRLRRLLADHGFAEIRRCPADQSRIPDFASYELDTKEGRPRKPDSLYMEAIKPR